MFTKLQDLWYKLPFVGKIAVVLVVLGLMWSISSYNGVVSF